LGEPRLCLLLPRFILFPRPRYTIQRHFRIALGWHIAHPSSNYIGTHGIQHQYPTAQSEHRHMSRFLLRRSRLHSWSRFLFKVGAWSFKKNHSGPRPTVLTTGQSDYLEYCVSATGYSHKSHRPTHWIFWLASASSVSSAIKSILLQSFSFSRYPHVVLAAIIHDDRFKLALSSDSLPFAMFASS
jgi:hypothetical protein